MAELKVDQYGRSLTKGASSECCRGAYRCISGEVGGLRCPVCVWVGRASKACSTTLPGVPHPAGEGFEAGDASGVKVGAAGALPAHPRSQWEASGCGERRRDFRAPATIRVLAEQLERVLPGRFSTVPRPAGQGLQSGNALGGQRRARRPLLPHPSPQAESRRRKQRGRRSGIRIRSNIPQQVGEGRLPSGVARVPCPSRECIEARTPLRCEPDAHCALSLHPPSEGEAPVGAPSSGHQGVAALVYVGA